MIAVIRGPYCTGAVTPPGAGPQVVAPHEQRRAISRCSVTWTVIGGRSNTCRRSTPTSGASARPAPQPTHGPARAAASRSDRRPAPASSRMPGLPTRLAPAAAPQRLRPRLGERRVRRRRLGRVHRGHPQPAPQLGVLGLQHGDPRTQLFDHPRLLADQGSQLVIRRTPTPGQHPMIISCRRSSLTGDLISYLLGCFEPRPRGPAGRGGARVLSAIPAAPSIDWSPQR